MARGGGSLVPLATLSLVLLSSSLLVTASDPLTHIALGTDSSRPSRSFTTSLISLFYSHSSGDDEFIDSEAAGASVTDPVPSSDYVSDDVDLTDDFDLWKNLIKSSRPVTASTGVTVTNGHIYLPEIRMNSFFAQHSTSPRSFQPPTLQSSSSSNLIYPFNISAVYQARWTAAPNTSVANVIDGEVLPFAFKTGEYLFRLASFADTRSPLLHYVEGVVNIRDSADTPDKDFRFRVRGLYFLNNGLCFLYSPAPTETEFQELVETVQSWNDTTDLAGAVSDEFIRMVEAAARQEGEAIESSQVTDCHMRIAMRFAPVSDAKSDSQSAPASGMRPQDTSDGSSSSPDDYDSGTVNLSNLFILSGSLESPNCGLNMTISDISVFRFDLWYSKVINYCIMVVCMSAIQIYVLMQQMRDVATPSRAVKVSLASIGQQALLDSYLCFMHLAAAMYFEPLFHAFLTTAFFEFIIFSLFEMRFLLSIWKARRPDAFNSGFDVMRREFSKLYIRFYLFLIIGLIVLYQARTYLDLLVFVLYSFWVPQIVSNAKADVSKSLSPRYIIGISVTRLAIPLYVWGCPENVIKMPVNPYVCIGLTLWMGIQIGVLMLQDRFGPRFFIPPQFLPPKYNYHQLSQIPQTDVESGEENPCAICYSAFEASFDPRTVMRTPCDHVFHTECLTRWMDQKMECPTCRGPLPPL